MSAIYDIKISWLMGKPTGPFKQAEDRALAAARKKLDDPVANYLEIETAYNDAVAADVDVLKMAGLAAKWRDAIISANVALTADLQDPDNAYCVLDVIIVTPQAAEPLRQTA